VGSTCGVTGWYIQLSVEWGEGKNKDCSHHKGKIGDGINSLRPKTSVKPFTIEINRLESWMHDGILIETSPHSPVFLKKRGH